MINNVILNHTWKRFIFIFFKFYEQSTKNVNPKKKEKYIPSFSVPIVTGTNIILCLLIIYH